MISFSAMEEGYYGLKYKSSPEKFSYVLYVSDKKPNLLGTSLTLKQMGIKSGKQGRIFLPPYFFPLIKISKNTAFEIISRNTGESMENLEDRVSKI